MIEEAAYLDSGEKTPRPAIPSVSVVGVIASLAEASGGPARTVPSLYAALAQHGVITRVLTGDSGRGQDSWANGRTLRVVRLRQFDLPRLRLSWNPGLRTFLSRLCREEGIDLIHNHGCWLPINSTATVVAQRLNMPLIFTPHGMLRRWALNHKRLRKRLAWSLYQARALRSAALIHVTSVEEGIEIREMGLRNPVAVIPHGVDMPDLGPEPLPREPRVALFLGRLYPVKGLENLLEAWAAIRPKGWRLVLAGPDEAGYKQRLERKRSELRLNESVQFAGAVGDRGKWAVLQSANLFVLPSFSENFGLSVAEALACGLPVITTKGTPWREIEEEDCGWWVDLGVEPLAAALREAVDLSDEARRSMGARGRALIARKYGWPEIGLKMARAYEWVLGGGTSPEFLLG